MRLAHILVCHSVSPEKLLASIPHQDDNYWYIFLHADGADVSSHVAAYARTVNGNVFDYQVNRGLARSWNQGMHLGLEAGCDAFLLLNDDLFFYEGGYAAFRNTIEAVRVLSREVAIVAVNGYEPQPTSNLEVIRSQDFACCAIMKEAVERVGYFDEAFVPAYFEDTDYDRRCSLAGMTKHLDKRCLVEHARSSTVSVASDEQKAAWHAARIRNHEYFNAKWGVDDSGTAAYDRPFGSNTDEPRIDWSQLTFAASARTLVAQTPRDLALSKEQSEVARWADDEVRNAGRMRLSDQQIEALASQHRGIYIIDVTASDVKIRDKTNGVDGLFGRAEIYRDLIARITARLKLPAFAIAINVEDDAVETSDLPIFSFQKKVGSLNILLPDVDFFTSNHYWDFESIGIPENEPFGAKMPKAIFVGSTSGAGLVTRQSLDENRVPRVRLARFARDHANLDAYLPLIVQANAEAEAMLRAEGFGGNLWQWKDQIKYKFIVSMDGNGATCSRVYLALRSNCVLVKYHSDNLLYYFKGLTAGEHYVSVANDQDIVGILDDDHTKYEHVATKSALFAKTYLNRDMLDYYVERLLVSYAAAAC